MDQMGRPLHIDVKCYHPNTSPGIMKSGSVLVKHQTNALIRFTKLHALMSENFNYVKRRSLGKNGNPFAAFGGIRVMLVMTGTGRDVTWVCADTITMTSRLNYFIAQ